VSRLFPERLSIELAPDALTVGGKRIACDPRHGAERWHGALAALGELPLGKCRVAVELSNHFVRYALIPWSDALASAAEEEAYVRHHFAKIHGERAKSWAVRASAAPAGAPRLASAVDAGLIEAIKKSFAGKKAKLVSIQPALMSRYNACRNALPAQGAWLVVAEADRACVALHGARAWRTVQNAKGDWRTLLERERHRVEGEIPELVLLAGAPAPAAEAGWTFQAIAA